MTTVQPDQLQPLVQEVTAALHTLFQRYGLSLNMQKGKTEVVMMYRGKDANRCRWALFDAESPPMIVTTTPTHVLSIRVVPSYRHLGARYTMDLDIDEEITSRIGMGNRPLQRWSEQSLATEPLIQMLVSSCIYESLVLTRLLYGCSVWSDVPTSLIKQLEAMIIKHHRSIHNCGFWTEDGIPDDAFVATHQVMPFRLHWARHRLVYLQHVARHGLPVHIQLLHAEYATGKGWLHEVSQELMWMSTLIDLPFEPRQCGMNSGRFWLIGSHGSSQFGELAGLGSEEVPHQHCSRAWDLWRWGLLRRRCHCWECSILWMQHLHALLSFLPAACASCL